MITFLKSILTLFIVTIFCTSYGQKPFGFILNQDIEVDEGTTLNLPWAGGLNAAQFSRIDINLDGNLDLLIYDRSGKLILPFIHDGATNSLNYTYSPQYVEKFPVVRSWVLCRDYNCDGKMDIFTSNFNGIRIYTNTSSMVNGLQFEEATSLLYSFQDPNYINLVTNATDIPAIDDIDGDGDLDILCFGMNAFRVEYHKNLSMETYGSCDSLNFELRNKCWGYFREGSFDESIILFDTCSFNVSAPEMVIPEIHEKKSPTQVQTIARSPRHSGSTLLSLDIIVQVSEGWK